jgi:hypothetical protein
MHNFDFGSENLAQKLLKIQKKTVQLSTFRILVFFGLGALSILALAEHPLWLVPAGMMAWLFIYLIRQFNFTKNQEAIFLAIEELEKRKAYRQKRELSKLEQGAEFAEKAHPFSNDLDLFGAHSLFQLLNHTTSSKGKEKLSQLMKSEFSSEKAQQRAAAVEELKLKGNLLQALESIGLAFGSEGKNSQYWEKWLQETHKVNFFHKSLALVGPLGGISLLTLIYLGIIPQAVLGLWIFMGILVLSLVFTPLKQAAESIPISSQMKSLAIRAEKIETEDFHSELLSLEKSRFFSGKTPISSQLIELDKLGLWVQNRINLLYLPINLLFWTDFLLFIKLETWKNRVSDKLHQLTENLENWEVWVSLGSFEVEVGFPAKISWCQDPVLEVKNAVHPLIPLDKAVPNSVNLGKEDKIALLTGANMSGKTTFMRTLGINAVLVNLGLRPFAEELRIGPIQLYTSMRNSDNLGESVSSFYAELHRIRMLISRLEAGESIFFLLDEILKGTNTQDRISGSEALIHQMLNTQGFGIISTHDIELAELSNKEPRIKNYSFHSEIMDQAIEFDYNLKIGPCPSFNAHKLMELMGIKFGKNA